jgi:hypothetical protein
MAGQGPGAAAIAARLNIADALAWQRDAAKAGAPLSREPLAGLRTQLVERIKTVEDLQQRVMVQREAAALLAQRIELLSTKPWTGRPGAAARVWQADLAHWRAHAQPAAGRPAVAERGRALPAAARGRAKPSSPPCGSAFTPALAQAAAAAQDAAAPLPPVPVWADETPRRARRNTGGRGRCCARRRQARQAEASTPSSAPPPQKAVEAGTMLLEQAVAAGHTKNTHSATQALRQSLKAHGRLIDDALEARVHAALVSPPASWKAGSAGAPTSCASSSSPAPRRCSSSRKGQGGVAPADEAADAEAVSSHRRHRTGRADGAGSGGYRKRSYGRADQTSAGAENNPETVDAASATEPTQRRRPKRRRRPSPNRPPRPKTLWPPPPAPRPLRATRPCPPWAAASCRTPSASCARNGRPPTRAARPTTRCGSASTAPCNAAHQHVDAWLAKVRADAAEHRAHRLALIDDVKAFGAAHAPPEGEGADWKAFNRQIHQFSDRWRNAGHLSEKAVRRPAAAVEGRHPRRRRSRWRPPRRQSTARRQALIQPRPTQLGAAPHAACRRRARQLQQRWQAEAQAVPLDRKHEQKAVGRLPQAASTTPSTARAPSARSRQAAMSAHDKAVLDAAKALEAANASGDAQRIRAAMAQLDAATRGELPKAAAEAPASAPGSEEKPAPAGTEGAAPACS